MIPKKLSVYFDLHSPLFACIAKHPHVNLTVDRAHYAVASLLFDQLLDREAVNVHELVQPVNCLIMTELWWNQALFKNRTK